MHMVNVKSVGTGTNKPQVEDNTYIALNDKDKCGSVSKVCFDSSS